MQAWLYRHHDKSSKDHSHRCRTHPVKQERASTRSTREVTLSVHGRLATSRSLRLFSTLRSHGPTDVKTAVVRRSLTVRRRRFLSMRIAITGPLSKANGNPCRQCEELAISRPTDRSRAAETPRGVAALVPFPSWRTTPSSFTWPILGLPKAMTRLQDAVLPPTSLNILFTFCLEV